MKRELVLAEWQRALGALRASEVLTREECFDDAVSRTYYAVLHAAKAALYVHDVAAESHAGVRRMFGLHLIKTGEVEKEWAVHLGESLDDRLAADYDPEVAFSQKDARRECRQTRRFVRRLREYLKQHGFTDSELRRKASRG